MIITSIIQHKHLIIRKIPDIINPTKFLTIEEAYAIVVEEQKRNDLIYDENDEILVSDIDSYIIFHIQEYIMNLIGTYPKDNEIIDLWNIIKNNSNIKIDFGFAAQVLREHKREFFFWKEKPDDVIPPHLIQVFCGHYPLGAIRTYFMFGTQNILILAREN